MPARILTSEEVVNLFGDPSVHLTATGEISRAWEQSILVMQDLPSPLPLLGHPGAVVTRYRCHHRVAHAFAAALARVAAEREVWSTIGDWGGCYAYRTVRGAPRSPSRHSWGIAIDIDVADNPMGSTGRVDPRLIDILGECGLFWGGYFHGTRRDPMHWEFAAPWLLEAA